MSIISRINTITLRYFPPPTYMRMQGAGFDITDGSVKFVALSEKGGTRRVGAYGMYQIPEGVVEQGIIKKPAALVPILRKIRESNTCCRYAHVSLPEDHAYLFDTEISVGLQPDEAMGALEFKLKENVPIPPQDAIFDYQPLVEEVAGKNVPVAVAAYPKEVIETYQAVFAEAGVEPLTFEIEGDAGARSVLPFMSEQTFIVVDLGRLGSGLSVINNGVLAFTSTLEVCGDDLTHAIAKRLAVSYEEAEQIKLTRGFVKGEANAEVFETLLGLVSALRDEITKHYLYWQVHSAKKQSYASPVDSIVLIGGGANLKGLLEYLKSTMDLPVSIGNVWTNVASFDEYIPPIPQEESLRYATAIGLALRSMRSLMNR